MKRRAFLIGAGSIALSPPAARAQQSGQPRRVGILMPYPDSETVSKARVLVLKQELSKLGWADGRNIHYDERWTTDDMDRVRAEAASLMASQPDVVVALGGRVIPVLLRNSRSIPIVVPGGADPVSAGWVTSLAHPGGNVTGFSFFEDSIIGKMLEILKRIATGIVRVGFLYNPDNLGAQLYRRTFEVAAGSLQIEPLVFHVRGLSDIERETLTLSKLGMTGLLFPPDITLNAWRNETVDLAARYRLPAMYWDDAFVKIGGLASYSTDRIDLYRRAAGYVDRILRGEKPGDLPFQQPTVYRLVINLATAKALSLELSPTALALADEVIE